MTVPLPASRLLPASRPRASWAARASAFAALLPAAAFALLAAPLCAVLALVVPVGQGPDEAAHVVRAASLLRGEIVGRRALVPLPGGGSRAVAGVDADPALLAVTGALPPAPLARLDAAKLQAARDQPWTGPRFLEVPNTAVYMPLFYGPPALGLAAARALGAGPHAAVRAARLATTAAYVALGLAALLLARRGRWLLFCALALPMSVFLASVVNQDGLLVAATALAAALVSRVPEPVPGRASRRSYGLAACLVACVAAAKPPYIPLAAMLLLPFPARGEALLRRLGAAALAAAPMLAWTWLAQRNVAVPLAPAPMPYAPGPLWPGDPGQLFGAADPGAQLAVLSAGWTRLVTLPWRAVTGEDGLLPSFIGVLGWLTVRLPDFLYAAWEAALGASLLAGLAEPARPRRAGQWAEATLLLAAAVLAVQLVCLAQYLTWTRVGLDHIEGVQGRYFLPLLPLAALAVPQVSGRGGALYLALSAAPLAAALLDLAVLPAAVVEAWYLR